MNLGLHSLLLEDAPFEDFTQPCTVEVGRIDEVEDVVNELLLYELIEDVVTCQAG
jgi:hypothetical protein